MNLNSILGLIGRLAGLFSSPSSGLCPSSSTTSLAQLANRFEDELADRTFVYTFRSPGGQKYTANLEFERSGFCHLFSIGSIAKGCVRDEDEYAGMRGWKNIRNGTITFEKLQVMNPEGFAYYSKEYDLADALFQTIRHPQAVLFDASKVPGSKLKSDILLYGVYGGRTVHLGICADRDGSWFARSYFVRDNAQDRQYPTKYIAPMVPLEVTVRVSSKKA